MANTDKMTVGVQVGDAYIELFDVLDWDIEGPEVALTLRNTFTGDLELLETRHSLAFPLRQELNTFIAAQVNKLLDSAL